MAECLPQGLDIAAKHFNTLLKLIAGRLGLDHGRVVVGRFGAPAIVCFIDKKDGAPDAQESDKLLPWFAQVGMSVRFSGSTESAVDQCLATLNFRMAPSMR